MENPLNYSWNCTIITNRTAGVHHKTERQCFFRFWLQRNTRNKITSCWVMGYANTKSVIKRLVCEKCPIDYANIVRIHTISKSKRRRQSEIPFTTTTTSARTRRTKIFLVHQDFFYFYRTWIVMLIFCTNENARISPCWVKGINKSYIRGVATNYT